MSITQCKPQQQTLSIRVSESLREFLELSRQVIANGQGDAVSISDIAKLLLDGGRRITWISGWKLLNYSSHQLRRSHRSGENGSGTAFIPGRVGASRSVRLGRLWSAVWDYDHSQRRLFHRGTRSAARRALPSYRPRRRPGPLLPGQPRRDLRCSPSPKKVVFAGRNLYVAFRDEVLSDVIALNFFASADKAEAEGHPLFHFCVALTTRVLFSFSEGEWRCVKELFSAVLEHPSSNRFSTTFPWSTVKFRKRMTN
jgi:hypothetical protein